MAYRLSICTKVIDLGWSWTAISYKSSALDPIPVPILKAVSDLLAPFLTYLFNISLSSGRVPAAFKDSFVTPVIKKPGSDEGNPSSYRPISNLSVISKIMERFVARQLVSYLDTHRLLPATQSDRGDSAALVLLDLTAAFDTVDHEILLKRLRATFGDSIALAWFLFYLAGRKQQVRCGGKTSSIMDVICGVPQGSVLGPILFIIYTADLAPIVTDRGLSLHQYADDSQIYDSCLPAAISSLSTDISQAVDDVSSWMRSNRL